MEDLARDLANLVVIHADPASVGAFIPPGELERVRFLNAGELAGTAVSVDGLEWHRGHASQIGFVCLPVDGPRAATELAMALLERGRAVICVYGVHHEPVDWSVLGLTAGRPVGLDLRRVSWHDPGGMWWTEPTGPVWLPISPAGRDGGRRAAEVLVALSGRGGHADVVTGWLAAVASGGDSPDEARWSAALCARYVREAAALVERRSDSPQGSP